MKIHYALLIGMFCGLLISCETEKFPGYSEAEPGIYYKLHIPGESGKKAGEDDYYEVVMQNKYGGKIFFDSEFQTGTGTMFVQASTSKYFSVLGEGDSATFLLPGGDLKLPGTPDTGMVEMNVKVIRIVSVTEYDKMAMSNDLDADEALMIDRYLRRNNLTIAADSTGFRFQTVKEGNGNAPSAGKDVTIGYKGFFLNGRLFDDTKSVNHFTFTWGQEGQVIPGMQKAIARMKAGGKAKIILPSQLAFGTGGSSSGIVPPHTPVVYELDLISVE